jgi:DNA topoisomerase-3
VFAEVPDFIAKLTDHPTFGKQATALSGAKLSKRSVNAKKVTDHHAVLTTGVASYQLTPDQQSVYDMVAGRMLEVFHQDCIKEIIKLPSCPARNLRPVVR